MVESYKEFYGTNRSIADLCGKFLGFGITLIQKSMSCVMRFCFSDLVSLFCMLGDQKLVQRAKEKPMSWHLKQMMKQKREDNRKRKGSRKQLLNTDPVDLEGFWKIPYNKIKYKRNHKKLEKLDKFTFENPFKYEAIFEYIPCVEQREQLRKRIVLHHDIMMLYYIILYPPFTIKQLMIIT